MVMNAFRSQHLELEVGVVGDGHKLGVAGTTKDGMIGPSKSYYLEGEYLLAEVSRRAEADGQVDLSEGLDSLSRHDAVKWLHAWA